MNITKCKDCIWYHKKSDETDVFYFNTDWCEWVEANEGFCSMAEPKKEQKGGAKM